MAFGFTTSGSLGGIPPMKRTIRHSTLGLALLAGALVLAPAVSAGTYADKRYGFKIKTPAKWTQTPTQPGETTEVAKFKDDRKGDFSTLSIYRFTTKREPVATPEDGEESVPQGLPPGFGRPDNAREYLDSLLESLSMRTGEKFLGFKKPKKTKFGKIEGEIFMYDLKNKRYRAWSRYIVAGIIRAGDEEYLIFYRLLYGERKKTSPYIASIRSFRFPGDDTPTGDDEKDLEKRDKTKKSKKKPLELVDLEKREKIKKELVGTWRFIDTTHYIVIYNCDDGLARFIATRIEWMLENAFSVVFPPVEPIKEAMVVRICKEMDEYHHYGGPGGSAGYWASFKDEFVLPDLSQSKKPDTQTIGVLHHEGFHQYIYYSLLKNNPPVWFNEGFAEYFFCVKPPSHSSKKMQFLKRHPMRHSTVKSAAGSGDLIHANDFIRLTHRQYMQQAQLCYSQGWAFSTWLKNITRNERYRKIPEIYFQELQKGFLEASKSGGAADLPDGLDLPDGVLPGGLFGNKKQIEQDALEKAFEGIDMEKLNSDFRKDIKSRM
jgi:hypothetical protein